MRHHTPLEQTPITSQQNTVLAAGDVGQFFVGVVIAVEGVKTEHTQVNGQPRPDVHRGQSEFRGEAGDGHVPVGKYQ